MEVFNTLGRGFLEAVYQDALEKEFSRRVIPFMREYEIPVFYKGERLASRYRADFLCYGEVVVELKALKEMGGVEDAQLLNYLKATNHQRGLLLNFGADRLDWKRRVLNYHE